MFINDVGQNAWEEINVGEAGSNYGWPSTEGPEPSGVTGVSYPHYQYQNAGSNCAIVGGAFYEPPSPVFPSLYHNGYFFGDYCGGFIRMLAVPYIFPPTVEFATGISSLVDIQIGPDGALYYASRGDGAVYRVWYTANAVPQITTQPASQTVVLGQPVTFSVRVSGSQPFSYQWQRNGANIPGATSSGYTIAATSLADNGATFRVRVTNSFGSAISLDATLTVLANNTPTATITSPTNGAMYRGGQTFTFAGTGTDPEDGSLPASAFSWRVDFYHDNHTHPHMAPTSGITTGTFTIADRGETSTNVFYRVVLTVRDSTGLTDTRFVDVVPRTSVITLATNPAGLQLTLDGQTIANPSVASVEGVFRTLGAPSPQTVNGTTYEFVSWSDGGAATHDVLTPTDDVTYTATFRQAQSGTVFSDDFETDRGWTLTSGNTATSGRWQRGDPEPTTQSGVALQLGTCDGPSTNCLITGLTAGTSAGANDVDGGVTVIQSPAITLPSTGTITLSFRYYLAHTSNSSSSDYFRVRVIGTSGTPTTVFQSAGAATNRAAVWTSGSANLGSFAGQTVRILFETADAGLGSYLEAGVDNVSIRN